MLRIFQTSDIHIGAKNKYFGDNLLNTQKKYLNKLFKNAVDSKVKFVVIAGDLFDSNYIPSSIVKEIFEIFLQYNSINTLIIPGGSSRNIHEIMGHDAYTKDSIYRRPELQDYFMSPNIHIITPENRFLVIENVAFYSGFFEIPTYEKKDAKYHIGIIHGSFGNGENKNEIPIYELEKKFFDYICLGHYHCYRKFKKSAYSGSLVQLEFLKAKDARSGYLDVVIDDNLTINHIVFEDAPRFLKVEIISKEQLYDIKNILTPNTYIQITAYNAEVEEYIKEFRELNKNNIIFSNNLVVYERDGILGIIENILEEILCELDNGYDDDIIEEIKALILNNIKSNPTRPQIEDYLQSRFEL